MHVIISDEKRWLSESRFLHAGDYRMTRPGTEAPQLAADLGCLMHKTWGGGVAGSLFVLLAPVSIMALGDVYVLYGKVPLVPVLFFGLKAAVLAIVVGAVAGLGKRASTMRLAAIRRGGVCRDLLGRAVSHHCARCCRSSDSSWRRTGVPRVPGPLWPQSEQRRL
ncbi:MAG: hypothetical protein KatS3mg077_1192 [Candidatus Binatia bacterium]|nr:MAG: hypothetical protein KatS3mg077_1192 [Candidatus Binatia bacterium]